MSTQVGGGADVTPAVLQPEPHAPEADTAERQARDDWQRRIYRRLTTTAGTDASLALPAPTHPHAEPAVGHVRLTWDAVPEAAGYLIERTEGGSDAPVIVAHGGSDVPAVTRPPFADTGLRTGVDYQYRIGAVADADSPVWAWSEPVSGQVLGGVAAPVEVRIDAATVIGRLNRLWRMVGSERLSQLTVAVDDYGNKVGVEFAEALRIAHDDLGVTRVRAHAILHDDNSVVTRRPDGTLDLNFDTVDAVYDQVLELGIKPVVELSFMPAALARDATQTVFVYGGIISPPADWAEWHTVVRALAAHLVDRYGVDEVAEWVFEVWNEPNLVVFWAGTQEEYLRLYDEAARAVKSVDARLKIAGPSTAAAEWVRTLAVHAAEQGTALDVVTTHTYGNLPLDVRPAMARNGFAGVPIWWTEWGVGSTHFGPVHDSVAGAPFILSGFAAAQDQLDALAYWVVSDHFEELGRPRRLFHDGFGLLTVGNLRKPRYWAVHLAQHLGDHVLASAVDGDGADVLVYAWAARHDDGTLDVLVWNGTINTELKDGDLGLDRRIALTITGLQGGSYEAELARVDRWHSNVVAECPADVDWPDDALWAHLRRSDELYREPLPHVTPEDGTAHFEMAVPLPGVARVRLSPTGRRLGTDEESTT
ncbi:MAG: hypothetical protein ABJA34_06885 [Pseudonocardiales bacterium]